MGYQGPKAQKSQTASGTCQQQSNKSQEKRIILKPDLNSVKLNLKIFVDAEFAQDQDNRRSIMGRIIYLNNALVFYVFYFFISLDFCRMVHMKIITFLKFDFCMTILLILVESMSMIFSVEFFGRSYFLLGRFISSSQYPYQSVSSCMVEFMCIPSLHMMDSPYTWAIL